MSPRRLSAVALLLVLWAPRIAAQEFAAPEPAGEPGLAALLERGLAPAADGIAASALVIRWHGLPELDTRSVAVGVGWRSARVALFASQTGEADLGWSALGVAAGAGTEAGGFALRGCARRRAPWEGRPAESGGEVGAGAWVAATPSTMVWASAPQLWMHGDPPPLERWLEIGARAQLADARLWLARAAAPGAPRGLRAEHLAGIAVPCGPAAVWLEARDHPARGGLGLVAFARTMRVSATIEGHPVLGETVRLALGWGERPWW